MIATKTLHGLYKVSKFKKFIGPFKIIQVVSDVNYKRDLRNRLLVYNVFHVSKLKKFHGVHKCINYLSGEFETLEEDEQTPSRPPPAPIHSPATQTTPREPTAQQSSIEPPA